MFLENLALPGIPAELNLGGRQKHDAGTPLITLPSLSLLWQSRFQERRASPQPCLAASWPVARNAGQD